MCAVARADALLKVLMYYNFLIEIHQFRVAAQNSAIFPQSGMRFLNLARPREIEQYRSKKVVVHQHYYERYLAHMLTIT